MCEYSNVLSFLTSIYVHNQQWKDADEYIHACSSHDSSYGSLPPPQAYELNRLNQCQNLEELSAECERMNETGIHRWMPVFRSCKDALISILPGKNNVFSFHFCIESLVKVLIRIFQFLIERLIGPSPDIIFRKLSKFTMRQIHENKTDVTFS